MKLLRNCLYIRTALIFTLEIFSKIALIIYTCTRTMFQVLHTLLGLGSVSLFNINCLESILWCLVT